MKIKLNHLLAFFSFVIPTIIIGFGYKYGIYADEYAKLGMYRDNIAAELGIGSMLIQGAFWTYIASKLYLMETFWKRTIKLFIMMFPVGLSFTVFMVGAKHVMTSVWDFTILETGFTTIMYVVICPLISLSFSLKKRKKLLPTMYKNNSDFGA